MFAGLRQSLCDAPLLQLNHQTQRRAVASRVSTHQDVHKTKQDRVATGRTALLSGLPMLRSASHRAEREPLCRHAGSVFTDDTWQFSMFVDSFQTLPKHTLSEPHRSPPLAACSSLLRPDPSNLSSLLVTFSSVYSRVHVMNHQIQYLRQSAFCSSVPRNVKSTFVMSSRPSSSCGSRKRPV